MLTYLLFEMHERTPHFLECAYTKKGIMEQLEKYYDFDEWQEQKCRYRIVKIDYKRDRQKIRSKEYCFEREVKRNGKTPL